MERELKEVDENAEGIENRGSFQNLCGKGEKITIMRNMRFQRCYSYNDREST